MTLLSQYPKKTTPNSPRTKGPWTMKTVHFKHNTPEPQYQNPRLYCDTRLLQRHRVQTSIRSDVTCNRCRFLLGLPEVLCSKPYRKSLNLNREKQARRKLTHFDCGVYLFCDQRNYSKGYKVSSVLKDVDCHTCRYILQTGSKSLSEYSRRGYEPARGEYVYVPEPEPESRG